MSRSKYQRPEVYAWKGKSGEKFWKAEWRQYIEGRPKPKHRAATWPCAKFTKTKAQQECDRLVQEESGEPLLPDGSVTVAEFWDKVYFPAISHRIAPTTSICYQSTYRVYIEPSLGKQELQWVTKSAVSAILDRMADAGKAEQTTRRALVLVHELFAEAIENGYVVKNPAHRVSIPRCGQPKETRAMTEDEVRRLIEKAQGRDHLMWRILLLTGIRVGELLALRKTDMMDGCLCIDESSFEGKSSTTKNRKARYVPLPESLWVELEEWASTVKGDLIFPNRAGRMFGRTCDPIKNMLVQARKDAAIPDLTFRMCRTTFTTLFEGDMRDAQAILGHSTINLTMRVYRKAIAARQRASVEELDARFSGKLVTMPKKETQSA